METRCLRCDCVINWTTDGGVHRVITEWTGGQPTTRTESFCLPCSERVRETR